MNRQQAIEHMIAQLRTITTRDSTPTIYTIASNAADLLATIAREQAPAAVDAADVDTVREALRWHITGAQPLNVPGREGDLEAFERIATAVGQGKT